MEDRKTAQLGNNNTFLNGNNNAAPNSIVIVNNSENQVNEILRILYLEIFGELDPKSFARSLQVSKKWREIILLNFNKIVKYRIYFKSIFLNSEN